MRRALCIMCCLLLMPSVLVLSAAAAHTQTYAYPEPEVLQIDLLLHPSRYLRMIHTEEKEDHAAVVCINEGEPQSIGVQVCGDSSLREGLEMKSKRIPIELCFDYVEPDGAFRGNPSLKLLNCKTPARLLTQLIAMQVFAFLDIPTPQVTPAFLRINDTDFGLYLAVEDVNEAFIQNRFGNASLYRAMTKEDEPDRLTSFDSIEMYIKSDHGGQTLARYNEAKSSGGNAQAFLDVDEILRYLACEAFLNNEDGFLHGERNFYLADNHGKLMLIPWDKDDVFLAFYKVDSLRSFEDQAADFFHSVMQNETYYAQYRQYVKKLNDVFLNPDTFLPWLENYIRVLSPYFQRDATISLRSDDVFADLTTGNELYNNVSGNLLLTFRTYHDQLDAQLRGEAEAFTIPQGMTNWAHEMPNDDALLAQECSDSSIVYRVSAGYWRLQRQAFLQNEGKVTLVIAVFFVLVFTCTVIFVYRPMRRVRRRRHERNE